jgi:signal transduction histidine kinase
MRWRRLSLRARLLLLGVLGLSAGLAIGGIMLVVALNFTLQRAVDEAATQTARGVAELINEQGAPPDPVPVSGVDAIVQVIDRQSRVRSASIGADRLAPIVSARELTRLRSGEQLTVDGADFGADTPLRVVAMDAGPPDARLTVLVARSTAVVDSVRVLRSTLLVAFPLLVVILGLIAWRVVGAALRPVEALRRGAEEITGAGGPGQLPQPEAHDEIHRLAVTLNDMLSRLEAARSRQRAFVADAAHELRSPLTNMRTQLEVAQRLGDRTEWPAVADDLLADTERLSRLVEDLLLLARADDPAAIEAARRRAAPVELGELVADVAGRFSSPPVVVQPAERPCWVSGDADALCRVILNLIDNAVRHTRTRVVVEVVAAGLRGAAGEVDQHMITVTDDGPGIPAADRERVFDRFTRLDDARARDAGGAGLGLAIVRELVRRHGGTVRLADAHPGLRVEVRLPPLDDAQRPADEAGPPLRAVHTGADRATVSDE